MPIIDLLRRNAQTNPSDTALVEINPGVDGNGGKTWREFALTQPTGIGGRREITWKDFDEKSNRFANLLISRGVKKGTKIAILLMNCLEWLPVYFGILKAGAIAVPLNYRYAADEIGYCLNKADAEHLVFGPEFIGRVESNVEIHKEIGMWIYVGNDCPYFAESYEELTANQSAHDPCIPLTEADDAAIYFSSGTTGFPKAILHDHRSLSHAAAVEQKHHGQTKDDVFLRFIIQVQKCTGSAVWWLALAQFF